MPETTFAPLRLIEHFHLKQFGLLMPGYHHLRYPFTIVDDKRLRAQIYQYHTHVTTIVSIYGSWCVKHRDTILQGQATARTHLRLVSFRKSDTQARRHQATLHGLQRYGSVETGTQVHSSRQLR